MTPAAAIPMHTPQEAIEELEYAVKVLGMKAIMMAGYVRRPIRAIARKNPEAARHALWLDTFDLDSEYDYDPVWAKCVALKVPPTLPRFPTTCTITSVILPPQGTRCVNPCSSVV